MHHSRPPRHPALQPWIARLWLHHGDGGAGHRRELGFPSPDQRIVLRMHGAPMRRFRGLADARGEPLPRLQWCGLRRGPLLRSPADAGVTLGVELHPGASLALLGLAADRLAGHVDLAALLAGRARRELLHLRQRPADARLLEAAEEALLAWLAGQRAHLPVARAAQAAATALSGAAALDAATRCGLSHRAWLARLRAAVGCPARAWLDLRRFDASLARLHGEPALTLGEVALATGHADQAHFNRRFRRHAGIAPGTFRRRRGRWPRHLPLD